MKHSSSIEARILANINNGEEEELSTHAGAGRLGKIFDKSNKHLAADSVSKATLDVKKVCVAIFLSNLEGNFSVPLDVSKQCRQTSDELS